MASNTDLFKKLARKWVGSIGSGGVANDSVTTIPLASSTNLPTDTAVVAVIDRVDINGTKTPSLEESVIGVVSGTNLVTCTRGVEGTAQAHSAGAVVEILVTARGWNDIVDGFLEEHNQLGHTNTGGWIEADETWTYASADDPTFTITVPSGAASKYSAGMRIKLTNTAVKYFIITKVTDTVLTVYGGTDYNLVDAAITSPYYSCMKAPQGFPLNPDKWTVEVTDTTLNTQSNPTSGTWYNTGSISIDIPIGVWNVEYFCQIGCYSANEIIDMKVWSTLSTANNSESDGEFTTAIRTLAEHVPTSNTLGVWGLAHKSKILNLTTKDTYYLNSKTTNDNVSNLYIDGQDGDLIIRAVCSYL